ncbi:MAG: DUF3187 family protein [Porticoccaceae bacterium]|nr:DUF3187 family protein [Porticoccaceae bacterium]
MTIVTSSCPAGTLAVMQKCLLKAILGGLFSMSVGVLAESRYQPLQYADMNALSMHFGGPWASAPAVLGRGQWQWQLSSDIGNTVQLEGSAETSEQLLIDAETQRHMAIFEYGLGGDWNILLAVPYVRHSGGSLDGFIDDFHSALGFPSGPRAQRSADDFTISYRRDGALLVDIDQPQCGLGDVSLALTRDFSSAWEDPLSVGLRLKFPTGEADDLTGSGTYDAALWASTSHALFGDVSHYLSLATVVVEGRGGLLADMRNSAYGAATYGWAWRYSDLLEFKLQVDTRSAIYNHSRMRALGHSTAASIGGTLHLPRGYKLDIAVVEDIDVGTSPDVVFQLVLRHRWQAR